MSLKKFLVLPLLISIGIFIYFSGPVSDSFRRLLDLIEISPSLTLILLLAVILQLLGHIVQAKKTEFLFQPIKDNTTRFQFRALSIGYLFNMLLPLRLGELVRARIIAGGLDLSFSFALSLIIIERAFDAAILGFAGLLIIAIVASVKASLFTYIIGMIVLASFILLFTYMVVSHNSTFLKFIYHFTSIFRETIKNSIRFKVWSVIYGLGRTLKPKRLVKYLGYSLMSWALYLCSLLVLVQHFFPNFSFGHKILAAISPYYGLAIPAGPANLGVFSTITDSFVRSLNISTNQSLVYFLLAWALLVLPIAFLGLILLFVKTPESLWRRSPRRASAASLENKLHRTEDISQEMSRFLDSYFSGNTLSHIVHNLELNNNFRLLKYFKGGSDAITILALQDGVEVVKKIIPSEFEDRLKAQYEWLKTHQNQDGIVNVLREEKGNDYYAIDLEFRTDDIMLFDYMHQNQITDTTKVMDQVWKDLFKRVYGKPAKSKLHTKERDNYIKTHIFGCLEKAAKVDNELIRAAEPEKLIINGKSYDNLYQIIDKIKKNKKAWEDLATYSETQVVHGDVAIDNILVSGASGRSLLIDPAPDGNIINGAVFDFGKNMQSLHCGYEFLLRDEDPVYLLNGDTINYREHSSAQYTQLKDYVRTKLAPKYLNTSEQKAIIFHAAALHIRRLKHQVYYNPANVLKFYAVGVRTLNDYLAQYEKNQ